MKNIFIKGTKFSASSKDFLRRAEGFAWKPSTDSVTSIHFTSSLMTAPPFLSPNNFLYSNLQCAVSSLSSHIWTFYCSAQFRLFFYERIFAFSSDWVTLCSFLRRTWKGSARLWRHEWVFIAVNAVLPQVMRHRWYFQGIIAEEYLSPHFTCAHVSFFHSWLPAVVWHSFESVSNRCSGGRNSTRGGTVCRYERNSSRYSKECGLIWSSFVEFQWRRLNWMVTNYHHVKELKRQGLDHWSNYYSFILTNTEGNRLDMFH